MTPHQCTAFRPKDILGTLRRATEAKPGSSSLFSLCRNLITNGCAESVEQALTPLSVTEDLEEDNTESASIWVSLSQVFMTTDNDAEIIGKLCWFLDGVLFSKSKSLQNHRTEFENTIGLSVVAKSANEVQCCNFLGQWIRINPARALNETLETVLGLVAAGQVSLKVGQWHVWNYLTALIESNWHSESLQVIFQHHDFIRPLGEKVQYECQHTVFTAADYSRKLLVQALAFSHLRTCSNKVLPQCDVVLQTAHVCQQSQNLGVASFLVMASIGYAQNVPHWLAPEACSQVGDYLRESPLPARLLLSGDWDSKTRQSVARSCLPGALLRLLSDNAMGEGRGDVLLLLYRLAAAPDSDSDTQSATGVARDRGWLLMNTGALSAVVNMSRSLDVSNVWSLSAAVEVVHALWETSSGLPTDEWEKAMIPLLDMLKRYFETNAVKFLDKAVGMGHPHKFTGTMASELLGSVLANADLPIMQYAIDIEMAASVVHSIKVDAKSQHCCCSWHKEAIVPRINLLNTVFKSRLSAQQRHQMMEAASIDTCKPPEIQELATSFVSTRAQSARCLRMK